MLVVPISVKDLAADASRSNTYVTVEGCLHAAGGLLLLSDDQTATPPLMTIDGTAVLGIVQRVARATRALNYADLRYRTPARVSGYVMATGIAAVPYRFSHVERITLMDPAGETVRHVVNPPLYDVYVSFTAKPTAAQHAFLISHFSGSNTESARDPEHGLRMFRAMLENDATRKVRELEDLGFRTSVQPARVMRGRPQGPDPTADAGGITEPPPATFEVAAAWVQDVLVITISGVLRESPDLPEYEKRVLAAAEPAMSAGKSIVFDFSGVERMNGTPMRALMWIRKRSAPAARFAVTTPPGSMAHEVYTRYKFEKLMSRYDTVDAAIAAVVRSKS